MFFRCIFDVFSMFFFYVLSFYIMSFLYFCFSMFCRSMFRHRPISNGEIYDRACVKMIIQKKGCLCLQKQTFKYLCLIVPFGQTQCILFSCSDHLVTKGVEKQKVLKRKDSLHINQFIYVGTTCVFTQVPAS